MVKPFTLAAFKISLSSPKISAFGPDTTTFIDIVNIFGFLLSQLHLPLDTCEGHIKLCVC